MSVCINGLHGGTQYILSKFVHGARLGEVVDNWRSAVQKGLVRLRNALTGTSWSSEARAKSYARGRVTSCNSKGWWQPAGQKQELWKACGHQVERDSPSRSTAFWGLLLRMLSAVSGASSFRTCLALLRVHLKCYVWLGSLFPERH